MGRRYEAVECDQTRQFRTRPVHYIDLAGQRQQGDKAWQYTEYIGHYHVADVPGRWELDATQELNYPAVMRAILDTGYTGHVSQEFIPTWPDPLAALRHAVRVCDV